MRDLVFHSYKAINSPQTERVTLSKQATAPSSLTHTETIWTKHSDKSLKKKKKNQPNILKQIARQDYTKWSVERVRDSQKNL